jgi:hypothetical protein
MKCEKCFAEISDSDPREHAGITLCEDCYIDIVAKPKTCDPWAVYSAKNTASQDPTLTPEQQRILDVIKAKGPLSLEQICGDLDISEEEFRTNFAVLRHMELARGCKVGGQVCFALFDDQ